ncbi:MAG: hypothetical protein ABTQ25_15370 [Nitrosomonas ureae]
MNHLERKGFEEVYHYLVNYSNWKMENIFIANTPERNEFRRLPYRYLPPAFRQGKKLNRLAIAAHESGHAIAMTASYYVVGKAVIDIKDDPDGVVGRVSLEGYKEPNGDHPPIVQESMPCTPIIKMDILTDAAGFIGESLVGKMTGSYHEKFLVYCRCRYLDDQEGAAPLTNWIRFIEWCKRIILNNENLFWRITDDLLTNSKLTDPCKTLLHSCIKKEKTELFF